MASCVDDKWHGPEVHVIPAESPRGSNSRDLCICERKKEEDLLKFVDVTEDVVLCN